MILHGIHFRLAKHRRERGCSTLLRVWNIVSDTRRITQVVYASFCKLLKISWNEAFRDLTCTSKTFFKTPILPKKQLSPEITIIIIVYVSSCWMVLSKTCNAAVLARSLLKKKFLTYVKINMSWPIHIDSYSKYWDKEKLKTETNLTKLAKT